MKQLWINFSDFYVILSDINIGHLNCILKKKSIALSLIVPQNYHDSGLIIFFFLKLVFGTQIFSELVSFTLYFFFLIYFKSFKFKNTSADSDQYFRGI